VIPAVILILAVIGGGVVYYEMSRPKSDASSGANSSGQGQGQSSGTGGGGQAPTNGTTTVPSNLNLTIVPNPALSVSFYGLDYTPDKSQFPWCGSVLQEVVNDIKIISQLTHRVRLYGMDCEQAENVLTAIDLLKVDMKVILTVWVDSNDTTYARQNGSLWSVIGKHGLTKIEGISVGNEVIYRSDGGMDPVNVNTQLWARVKDTRDRVHALNPSISVFTTDLAKYFTSALVGSVDQVAANIHPFFAQVDYNSASSFTINSYGNLQKAAAPIPALISEVGWPTAPSNENLNAAVPSIEGLQAFLNTFICTANQDNVPYYFFEAFDEPWKLSQNDRETHWGLFTADRQPKQLTFPNCPGTLNGGGVGGATVPTVPTVPVVTTTSSRGLPTTTE